MSGSPSIQCRREPSTPTAGAAMLPFLALASVSGGGTVLNILKGIFGSIVDKDLGTMLALIAMGGVLGLSFAGLWYSRWLAKKDADVMINEHANPLLSKIELATSIAGVASPIIKLTADIAGGD